MQIAIIGTGQAGSALARGLKNADHELILGARDPHSAEVQALKDETGAVIRQPAQAAQSADCIILALPWTAAETAIAALGDLAGRIVIDCMNPLSLVNGALSLTIGFSTSGGEIVQKWLPGAHVVKTLNQVGAEVMAAARSLPLRPVMFLAGDHTGAKVAVTGLLADLGFEPLDAGDITRSRLLEPLGMVWINQAILCGMGRDWAFAATRMPEAFR